MTIEIKIECSECHKKDRLDLVFYRCACCIGKINNYKEDNKTIDNLPYKTRYISVKDWNEYHKYPSVGGLRSLIFFRDTNGFALFGVVKKIGNRVLIDEAAFFSWVDSQNA